MSNSKDLTTLTDTELQALPEAYRAVMVARIEGLKYGDTARKLDIPIGTVRSRINRARTMIGEMRKAAAPAETADV